MVHIPFRKSPLAVAALIVAVGVILLIAVSSWWKPDGTRAMDFSYRQKVSGESVLFMSFPALMDHESVESSLIVPEGVSGTMDWRDEILLFTPDARLTSGETYRFRLPETARTAQGSAIGKALEFVFTVAGPPVAAARLPVPGSRNVSLTSPVTVVFDRPMVPLTQVQGDPAEERDANTPLSIAPAIKGRWRWISTTAIEFLPVGSLPPSTRLSVSVPKGMTSVSGDALAEDFSWSFETIRPRLLASNPPADSTLAGPTTDIALTFNQDMLPEKAKDFLRLIKVESREAGSAEVSVPLRKIRFGTKEVDDATVTDPTTLVLEPARPLEFSSTYHIELSPDLPARYGELTAGTGVILAFRTVGALTMSGRYDYGNLEITFSNPIDEESLDGGISIDPPVKGWEEQTWALDTWADSRRASLFPDLEPSTKYTVTIRTVRDAFGQVIATGENSFTFTTPPLPPQLVIASPGEFGVFELGKPPVESIQAVNVRSVTMEMAQLTLPEFLGMRSAKSGNWEFAPEDLRDFQGYWTKTIQNSAKQNEWFSASIDLEKELGRSLGEGIYVLTVRSPDLVRDWSDGKPIVQAKYFTLTSIALTLKYSGDHALVWAVDMRTGKPVGGAAITFLSLDGTEVLKGTTDAQGFYESRLPLKSFVTPMNDWQPEFWVTARKGADFAFVSSRWDEGMRAASTDIPVDVRGTYSPEQRILGYLVTDRPIYRAGDTVSFKGFARFLNWDGEFSLPKGKNARVQVTDPNGKTVYDRQLPFSAFGSAFDSLPIDPAAPLGDYWLSLSIPPLDETIGGSFSVLAYRKPEYAVAIEPEAEEYFHGDTVEATIRGSYYFGAPMDGASVVWRAQMTDYFFNKVTDGWYSFALDDAWCFFDCPRETKLIAEGKGVLDASGRLDIRLPADIGDRPVSQVLTIEADITDATHQVVSQRISVPVHKSNAYVGVKSDAGLVTPGEEAPIRVIVVDPQGTPVPSASVRLDLFSRTWTTIRKKGVDGQYAFENEPKDTFIRSVSVRTSDTGEAAADIRIDGGGEYRIVASVRDDEGRESKASTSVYAWSSSYVNWPHRNASVVDIVLDRPEYSVGDTAVLIVKSPFQGPGVQALVTVEREGVLFRDVVSLESAAQAIRIPIREEYLPNAFVSVTIIKPRDGETFDDNGKDTGAPAYRIGYAKFSVDTEPKRLTISVLPGQERYLPGEEAAVTIRVRDREGNPVETELSLGVVDMSVLALTGFRAPDLINLFYRERGLGVTTAHMLSYLIERVKAGSKGGGGADLEARKRGNFRDTAYWNPAIVTDANGEAQVRFTLPDNLTTWQMLALGETKDHRFGAGEATVLTTKRVILRPVRPRFAVHGDEISLSAIVGNFLPDDATFTVTISGSGFTVLDDAAQSITVKSQSQRSVVFPVRITGTGAVTLVFSAVGEDARDIIEERFPIKEFVSPQAAATSGYTETSIEESVIVPTEEDAPEGSLSISVAPTLATYLPRALNFLVQFPYGCTEQTLSSFLPNVLLSELQEFSAFRVADDQKLRNIVVAGLERLSTFQRSDGGFGFWAESRESDPYLSAYALHALTLTRKAGYGVDTSSIDRVRSYLQGRLRATDARSSIDLALRSYILFVLAETGSPDVSLLMNLYEDRAKLPLFSRAQLAMAFKDAGTKTAEAKAEELLRELLNHARVDARGTHFEEADADAFASLMHSDQRTTAFVLQAIQRIDPENPLTERILQYLLAVREGGHWDTTQSTVQSLIALLNALKRTGEWNADFLATVRVSGEEILTSTFTRQNLFTEAEQSLALNALQRGEENRISIAKEGRGRLYYDVVLSYLASAKIIAPAEEGLAIRRSIEPVLGSPVEPTVGGTFRVKLTITAPETRRYVAVESPLPAGLEIIDVNLATSQKTLLSSLSTETEPWSPERFESGVWRFTHREFRDDAAFLFAEELPAGVYEYVFLVRASVPGTFLERPAHAWQMYAPEVFGQTKGGVFVIRP